MPSSDRDREKRIAVLGDSIVAGWGVREGHDYPALLQKWLNEKDGRNVHYSVINAGVPGDTVLDGCLRYDRDVRAHAPHTLLIGFGLNDGALGRTPYDAQRERRWRAQHAPWRRRLLCRRGKRALRKGLGGAESISPDEGRTAPRVRPEFFFPALSDLIRWGRRDGADVHLLSLTPVSRQKLSSGQWRRYVLYDNLIGEVARRHGVPLIDLDDVEDDPFLPASMLAGDGIHLLAKGHQWLARRVYAHLARERKRQ